MSEIINGLFDTTVGQVAALLACLSALVALISSVLIAIQKKYKAVDKGGKIEA